LPRQGLAALAGLRHDPSVRVVVAGEQAWVFWEPGQEEVLERVLPLTGAALYTRRDGVWYPLGAHLPAFEVPAENEALPLHRVLVPEAVQPEFPTGEEIWPHLLRLERDDRPRPTRALRCALSALASWADTATSAQLAGIRAARCANLVLLLGDDLTLLEGAERFWGERLLVPLGYRPWPSLPEDVLLEALGIPEGELLVLNAEGGEVISVDVFQALTRTGIRLARRVLA
jgi:hypothetical protein